SSERNAISACSRPSGKTSTPGSRQISREPSGAIASTSARYWSANACVTSMCMALLRHRGRNTAIQVPAAGSHRAGIYGEIDAGNGGGAFRRKELDTLGHFHGLDAPAQ